ncbi:MAG: tetratricopeptide repeat protein [Gammaproteobacteria bacterium]|nr:tetratricopeptide repeat protein [Gammaproteobacteria bacterium]MDH3538319.1 tetratricopeptide repeat protein [Gammaproteobacteria bacterium]
MKSIRLLSQLMLALALSFPAIGNGDQTNVRLDALFDTLQNSQDEEVLRETEDEIWDIWYQSGVADVDELMLAAAELVRAGRLAAAEEIYSEVIETLPEFSEGWNRRATVRFYQRDFEGSLADIEETLRLEPRHFGAIWGLGMIMGQQRDFQRAIIAFEKLLEIKPNSQDARPRIELLKQELVKEAV